MYELYTLKKPYEALWSMPGPLFMALLYEAKRRGEAQSFDGVSINGELRAMIESSLQVDPNSRPTCVQLIERLEAL
jgi:hypothetical protein